VTPSPAPPSPRPLDILSTDAGYRQRFFDADYWTPYVRWVVWKQFGVRNAAVRSGLAGTYPTFIADDRWVVKFFGDLFEGEATHAAELCVGLLRPERHGIPAPALLAHDDMYDAPGQWRWPYLVFEFMEGGSIGEAGDSVSHGDRVRIAREVAGMTRALHTVPIPADGPFDASWGAYEALIACQRAQCVENHREWGDLPDHLIAQIDYYLAPTEELIDRGRPPHLIHADITADHILGLVEAARWRTTALIDFGDAMVGGHLYELVALHLDVFRGDTALLAAYLDAYGVDVAFHAALPRLALSTCLLHRFDVFASLAAIVGDVDEVASLEMLADTLWAMPTGH
jgi:hygromycin-B 7''-O-kinase